MTADLAHATAVRALNEVMEDSGGYTAEDFRSVFSGRLAALLGMDVNWREHNRPLPHRMTPRQVRSLVYGVVDRMLPAASVLQVMSELDNQMALNSVPVTNK